MRASWGLGSNYNFLMIYTKKGDCINCVLFIGFKKFNELKGKIIHLGKKWLGSVNFIPPVVTGGMLRLASQWVSDKAPRNTMISRVYHLFVTTFLSGFYFPQHMEFLEQRLTHLVGKKKSGEGQPTSLRGRTQIQNIPPSCSLTQFTWNMSGLYSSQQK